MGCSKIILRILYSVWRIMCIMNIFLLSFPLNISDYHYLYAWLNLVFTTVCRKCIDKKLIDEKLHHCPVCNADLGCSPLDKLRYSPSTSFIFQQSYLQFISFLFSLLSLKQHRYFKTKDASIPHSYSILVGIGLDRAVRYINVCFLVEKIKKKICFFIPFLWWWYFFYYIYIYIYIYSIFCYINKHFLVCRYRNS